MFLQTHGVVAATIEGRGLQAPEVLHTWQCDGDQTVEELVHLILAERDLAAHRHAFAQLEAGDGGAGLGRDRLLSGDLRQVAHRRIDLLGVRDGLAHPHVDDDLVQLGDLHLVGVAELLLHRGANALAILGLQPRFISLLSHGSPRRSSWRHGPSCRRPRGSRRGWPCRWNPRSQRSKGGATLPCA